MKNFTGRIGKHPRVVRGDISCDWDEQRDDKDVRRRQRRDEHIRGIFPPLPRF